MSAEDALAKLEARVLGAVGVGTWLAAVDELRELVAMESPDVRRRALALVAPKVERAALSAVAAAFGLGLDDAVAIVEQNNRGSVPKRAARELKKAKVSKQAAEPLDGLDAAGTSAIAAAAVLAAGGADDATILAPIFGHATRVRGSVSDAINRGGNEGATAVADAAGVPTVWIAERNACVHCLAYAGRVVDPGEKFPGGLTYGKKSYYPTDIAAPPRHPNCRCTVEPCYSTDYANALKREADRSVLRGFSLESESMGVRLDAAKRLLADGVVAPKSVKSFAEKAIRDGKFPTRGRP